MFICVYNAPFTFTLSLISLQIYHIYLYAIGRHVCANSIMLINILNRIDQYNKFSQMHIIL